MLNEFIVWARLIESAKSDVIVENKIQDIHPALTKELMSMETLGLKSVLGLKVVDVTLAVGDAGISFQNDICLAIYNEFQLKGLSLNDAQLLIGKVVADVICEEHAITIKFENDFAIHIDMRDEAYTGPEAMQLRIPGEPIVIWN